MTPLQEYLNAVSILFPIVVMIWKYFLVDGNAVPTSFMEIATR